MKKENTGTYVTEYQCKKWIREMARGNTEAFRFIYEALYRPALLFALSMLGERELAEDIVQETFLRAYQNAGQFEGKCGAKTWIFSIVKHLCINALKEPRANEIPEELSATTSAFSELESAEALSYLNVEEQRLIVLHVFGGFRIKEAAAFLSLSEQQAYHRKRTAVQKLKDYYSKNN